MTVRRFRATIPPLVLQNLRTTNVTQTTIALAWDVYPGATGYEIRRNGTLVLTTASTTYSNSGHMAGTSYTYAVRPVVGGVGVASAEATLVVLTEGATSYTPTHYVAPFASVSGASSDTQDMGATAWAAATSAATPTTLGTAMIRAASGNQVRLAPGSYVGSGAGNWRPAWYPRNGGTQSSRLVFFAQYPAALHSGSPALLSKLKHSSPDFATFGGIGYAGATPYVTWDGVWVDQLDGGAVTPQGQCAIGGSGLDFMDIRRCLFDRSSTPTTDNYAGIRVQQSASNVFADNLFRGPYNATHHNQAAINLYATTNFVIEHNHFLDVPCGVFVKGDANQGVIRFNRFQNVRGFAVEVNAVSTALGGCDIYQNLATNSGGMKWDWSSDVGKLARVYNNTFVGRLNDSDTNHIVRCYPTSHATSMTFRDNIAVLMQGQQAVVYLEDSSVLAALNVWDSNVYHRAGTAPPFRIGGTEYALAGWRTVSGRDLSSIIADPQFVNEGAGDYRLQAGSPARTASSTGGPVGCYITGSETIGIRS